jgi:uncharacterized protein YaaW (UPF0174 family)
MQDYSYDSDLTPVLKGASNEDLQPLVDYILKASTNFISNEDIYKVNQSNPIKYVELIETEIRSFGGNTFVNLFRGQGPSYREVTRDVAGKLDVDYKKGCIIEEIENGIILKIMTKAWEKMSADEKLEFFKDIGYDTSIGSIQKGFPLIAVQGLIKARGVVAYKVALIVANAIAKFILGTGLGLALNATLARSIAIFAGPVGWALTGLWTALDIAGPAYRVTIPCVVHVAMLRQKKVWLKEVGIV